MLYLKGGTSPINPEVSMNLFLLLLNTIAVRFNNNFHLFNHICQVLCQLLYVIIVTAADTCEHSVCYTQR